MQSIVLSITLILMAVMALVFLRAVRAVNADAPPENVDRRRSYMIWSLLIFGVIVTVGSLREWPHDVMAAGDAVVVEATGGQWFWELDADEVPLGKTIVFRLQTEDVNHGFGVFNEAGELLFQTQVMPGYTNQVEYTFTEPGVYRVLCMEFCGVAHHDMIDEFTVAANEESNQ